MIIYTSRPEVFKLTDIAENHHESIRTPKILKPSKDLKQQFTGWWFQIRFYFQPYLGKWSILANNFQMGWFKHELDLYSFRHVSWARPWGLWHRCLAVKTKRRHRTCKGHLVLLSHVPNPKCAWKIRRYNPLILNFHPNSLGHPRLFLPIDLTASLHQKIGPGPQKESIGFFQPSICRGKQLQLV